MKGKVFEIFLSESPAREMRSVGFANLVAGRGIEGDRYFDGTGTFSKQLQGEPYVELSLIEREEIDGFNQEHSQHLGYGDLRRSIVTEGIRLNALVGKQFEIGEVKLRGIRLCEPCGHLAETVNELVLPHMVGRSGLRAEILESGEIRVGDDVSG